MLGTVIGMMERGLIPDPTVRWGIRRLCASRLRSLRGSEIDPGLARAKFADELKRSPVAVATDDANAQHYEIPAKFFQLVLGPYQKYSCALWDKGVTTLEQAEKLALEETVAHADLRDGQKILELGCGWGSLSLFMAARFPNSKITAVSNSNSQREYIMRTAGERGLKNLEVLTLDLGKATDLGDGRGGYDRIVSVEMLEHLRNYEKFFSTIQNWLKPGAKMFIHIFTHREFPYAFETEGEHNWMGKYFFTGGQMPARGLFTHFQKDFTLLKQWDWAGTHYQNTSDAWLANMDRHRAQIREVLAPVYGEKEVDRWIHRWRIFFLSVAELFGFDNGNEWGVTHYLFEKKAAN